MNFTVSSSALSSRLSAISRVINPKAIYPILEDFLFRIESGKLTVTAADNDTTLETNIDIVEADKDGQIALPAKTLLDALKEIPEQPLKFIVNDSSYEVSVKYQNGEYKMVGQNAETIKSLIPLERNNAANISLPNPLAMALQSSIISGLSLVMRPSCSCILV